MRNWKNANKQKHTIMKKLLILAALAGLLGAQQCLALTVAVTRNAGLWNDSGGEFTITDPPEPSFDQIFNAYAPVATFNGGFQTFCISTAISVLSNPQDATLDPAGVSLGAAYLYRQFATGQLADYDYSTTDGGRPASALALQNAIWELQGFTPHDPEAGADYVALVVGMFGDGAYADSGGQYGVERLLLTSNGADSQPMLALEPVPDAGGTLMLLGVALSSLGAFSRRFRS